MNELAEFYNADTINRNHSVIFASVVINGFQFYNFRKLLLICYHLPLSLFNATVHKQ